VSLATDPAADDQVVRKGSPLLVTQTTHGYRQSSAPSVDPTNVDVTVQVSPAVLSVLWGHLDLPDHQPVAHLVHYESAFTKELVNAIFSHCNF
jgi:hypothetical protein